MLDLFSNAEKRGHFKKYHWYGYCLRKKRENDHFSPIHFSRSYKYNYLLFKLVSDTFCNVTQFINLYFLFIGMITILTNFVLFSWIP